MKDHITIIFNGFLNLPHMEKLELVNAMNEYFDSNDRESIRADIDARFNEIEMDLPEFRCKCCGR